MDVNNRIIRYFFTQSEPNEFLNALSKRTKRYKTLLTDLVGKRHTIEYIFNELIALNESTLSRMMDDISNYVGEYFRLIKQGIYISLDRFDNALETSHDDIWTPIQIGLLEAAWDAMRTDGHIKIFLSIRQEAYAAYCSRNTCAASSSVVKIEYSKSELKGLVNHLVNFYENYSTIEDFLGFECFPNTITYKDEIIFDFMLRYSIGRPRDFVQFCGELSAHNDGYSDLEEKRIGLKEIVRVVSSDTIINSLYEELRMLMNCLVSFEGFNDFFDSS